MSGGRAVRRLLRAHVVTDYRAPVSFTLRWPDGCGTRGGPRPLHLLREAGRLLWRDPSARGVADALLANLDVHGCQQRHDRLVVDMTAVACGDGAVLAPAWARGWLLSRVSRLPRAGLRLLPAAAAVLDVGTGHVLTAPTTVCVDRDELEALGPAACAVPPSLPVRAVLLTTAPGVAATRGRMVVDAMAATRNLGVVAASAALDALRSAFAVAEAVPVGASAAEVWEALAAVASR